LVTHSLSGHRPLDKEWNKLQQKSIITKTGNRERIWSIKGTISQT
jgi:hypothetical protein